MAGWRASDRGGNGDDQSSAVTKRPPTLSELTRLDDAELLVLIREARAAGDEETARRAADTLFAGYIPHLQKRALLRLQNTRFEGQIDDVIQETLAAALSFSLRGQTAQAFRAWLHTILERRIADLFRGRGQDRLAADLSLDDVAGPAGPRTDADLADLLHCRDALQEELGRLSDRHRQLVSMILFRGFSTAEAARLTDLSLDNAYQILSRFQRRVLARFKEPDELPVEESSSA